MRKLLNEELERLSVEEFQQSAKTPLLLVLDNVRSHLNVGSVFRTADAFRLQAVYLCGITGCPPHREINKTALGATETVEWKYFENTDLAIEKLKSENYKIVCIEQTEKATFLQDFEILENQKIALVFGNEVEGVHQNIIHQADEVIEIPQIGSKHSLNIAVSAGIVVWDLFAKINYKKISN